MEWCEDAKEGLYVRKGIVGEKNAFYSLRKSEKKQSSLPRFDEKLIRNKLNYHKLCLNVREFIYA